MSFFSEFSSQIGGRHTVLLSKRELLGTSATICCLMGSGPYAMQCPRDSEDAALVRLLCESDPQAVELLLQCHGDRVRGYLHRRFPSLDAAETYDILVDAILKLMETFDPQRGSPGGWLVFLAHRAAIDVLRSGRTRGMPREIWQMYRLLRVPKHRWTTLFTRSVSRKCVRHSLRCPTWSVQLSRPIWMQVSQLVRNVWQLDLILQKGQFTRHVDGHVRNCSRD